MSDQAPAYQMYAGDWLKSRNVRLMNATQRGWYIQLLNEAWDGKPQCMLPNDDELLMTLAGVDDESKSQQAFNYRWLAVKRMFKVDGSYVYNERQMQELSQQAIRRDQASKAGLASAKAREYKRKELQRLTSEHLAHGNGRSTDVQRNVNGNSTLLSSSSSSSSSPILDRQTQVDPTSGATVKPKSFKQWTEDEFKQSIIKANQDRFVTAAQMVNFFDYWTEPTASGRFRFAMEKTWDTRKRLKRALNIGVLDSKQEPRKVDSGAHNLVTNGGAK